jgi:phage baseplate assembly protein W
MTPQLFSLYKMLLVVALDVWEPRLRVRRVVVDGDARAVQQGAAKFSLEVDFMPNGHKGDRTVQKQLRFGLSIMGDGLKVI